MADARNVGPRSADWLSIAEALGRILAVVSPLETEVRQISEAVGMVLAQPVDSPIDQPAWDNSAMDGFAVRGQDVEDASGDAPVDLEVIESIAAGDFPALPVGPMQATRIMTGAPVPAGADTVIRVEHTRPAGDSRVTVLDAADVRRNIRFRGEDIRVGDEVLRAGTMLRPSEIGLLATVGMARVPVHRRARVALLATGDELVDLADYDQVLERRKVPESNSLALGAAVLATGGSPISLGIAADSLSSLRERLMPGLEADALVTTAGASVGEHDVVKDALESLGMQLQFWRVRIRPGSPTSFGVIEREGRPALPVFGLPGNPVSALVTFEVLVRPALRRMLGRHALYSRTIRVRAAEPMPARGSLTHFLRVMLERDGDDVLARLTGPQGSGILTSMSRADALLVVPGNSGGLPAGAFATAVRLDVHDDAQDDLGYE